MDLLLKLIGLNKFMEKFTIKNRKGLNMVIVVKIPENPVCLAFTMHGLGGFKEQPHIQTLADVFYNANFTSVLFDTTNTFGESEGDYTPSADLFLFRS